jgi:4-amino-4-deoxy-L-arabinose transferase-like glycosyltransferase
LWNDEYDSLPFQYVIESAKSMVTSELDLSPKTVPPSGSSWRPAPVELVAWCALAWIIALGLLGHTRTAAFSNDGYQYLSIADNIRHGNGIKTSIVYFDAERSHGTIPAPMTTFPPMYSIFAAIVSMTGIPPEIAAVAISQVSFALLPLILGLAVPIGIRPWAFRTMMLLLVLNSPLLAAADAIGTETLFSLVVAAAVLCFSRALGTMKQTGLVWQIGGWLLIGLSYWIRYAGLFVLAGALAFFGLHAVIRRGRSTLVRLATSVLALSAVGANMARNWAVSGLWKGGVGKHAIDRVPFAPRPVAVAFYHVLFGELKAEVNVAMVFLLLGVVGLLLLGFWSWRQSNRARTEFGPAFWMLWVLISTYSAALIYADLTMVISFGTRYFIPLLPLIFLLIAYLLSAVESPSQRPAAYFACVALVLTGYFAFHVRALIHYIPPVPHEEVLQAFREPGSGGDLTVWERANLSPAEVITATNGQATAYALHQPTLCVVDPPFSEVWNRDRLLKEMQRFGSNYLIIYPGLRVDAAPVQQASPFIRAMLSGEVPDGLVVVARNGSVIVLRRILQQ